MERNVIILILLVVVGLFGCYSYRRYIFKKVYGISKNAKALEKLNELYTPRFIPQQKRKITHSARSRKQYAKLNGRDIVLYQIENNTDGIRDDIELGMKNKERYNEYLEKVALLNWTPGTAELNSARLTLKKFKNYEAKLIKHKTLSKPYLINLKIVIFYSSPKGQRYYEKQGKLDFDGIIPFYMEWCRQKSYRISAKYERSLMSDSLRYDVLRRDNFQCCICGASRSDGAKLHVDHIIPVSKGGKTVMSNLQTLCERCNLGKSNKL